MDLWVLDHSRKTFWPDFFAFLMAATLPWSTTALGLITVLWLISVVPILNVKDFSETLKRPECLAAVTLFGLGVTGMLWSEAPWVSRIHATASLAKLLAVPVLLYQFERSKRGHVVFIAFLISCSTLLVMSWLNWIDPQLVTSRVNVPGVIVKNWITQGQEFLICAFGCGLLSVLAWRSGKIFYVGLFASLSAAFIANMVFVVSSRTALVSLPLLLVLLATLYLNWRRLALVAMALIVAACALWLGSPYLRERIESINSQLIDYKTNNAETSAGLRLLYWTKSLKFISAAPLVGHGTGSIRSLFERDTSGKEVSPNEIVANPHNQTLYFGIEWGTLGMITLFSMWIIHFLLFCGSGWPAFMGTIIVAQNFFASLFNSHISDYVEGWIYVIGVGVAAGTLTRIRSEVRLPTT